MSLLPFANLFIDNVDPNLGQRQPRDVLIKQGEYEHDRARITLDFDSNALPQYASGTPLTIQWGWDGVSSNSFTGYVNHTTPVQQPNSPPVLQILCTSADASMNKTSEHVFTNASVPGIVNDIAAQHGFASVVSPEVERVWEMLPQLNRSNWDLLVWVAQQCGFSLTCDKTTIYLQPRVVNPRAASASFFLNKDVYAQTHAIYKFTQRDGVSPFNSHDILAAMGITDQGSIINLVERGDPADVVPRVVKQNIEQVITDVVAGYKNLSGQIGLDRFHVDGNATVSGDPSVRPAGTIQLAGLGDNNNGFWWVNSVDHHITLGEYTMDLSLGRDSVPMETSTPVAMSWAGKPEVSSDPGVGVSVLPIPPTIYQVQDPSLAMEPLLVDPFAGLVSVHPSPALSPARLLARKQRPVPDRKRGASPTSSCCVPDFTPKYYGWRAQSSAAIVNRSA